MARKKVVLFIVEGITDQESLELLLTELFEKNSQVIFEVVGGDITTDYDVHSRNIKKKLTEIIKDGGKRKFKASDYKEVVHLVDMDGIFISEDNIYQDDNLFTVKKEYKESWDFIRQDNNSIKRFSNLNILLDNYLEQ